MRVLHIGKFFPPHPGGIERCTADLCSALNTRGVETAVLAHAEPGSRGSRFRSAAGVDVALAACHGRLLYVPLSPGFPLLLSRTIRAFRPELLHLHLPNTSAFFALLSPAARRVPWVVHWHADIPIDTRRRLLRLAYRVYRPWEQALLRRAAAIIATSEPYRDSSVALAPWRGKTHVIPLGIPPLTGAHEVQAPSPPTSSGERAGVRGQRDDHALSSDRTLPPHPALPPIASDGEEEKHAPAPEVASPAATAFSARRSDRSPLRILSVGRLSYFKGIDVLLRALAELPDAVATVVGDGECRAGLERLARELGVNGRVRFSGRVDMDDAGAAALAAIYTDADVFCLPSIDRAESFGLVLLEAMRARLPVVASAIPGSGVGFVVRSGETGLLVPPRDASALAQALRRLAADPSLRRALGAAGAQRWHDEFTLDRAAERVLQLYRTLLRTDPARAATAPAG